MQSGEEGGDHAADHHVMKMRHHEIGLRQVDIGGERGHEQAGQAAHREESDKAERIEHRRVEPDEALVHRADPVEHFDRGRHRNHVAQDREHQRGIERRAGHEHVMAPHQEADHRDRDAAPDDEFVAEEPLAREGGNDLADTPKPGRIMM